MTRTFFKATIVTTVALLGVGMFVGAQSLPEAPAGFDGTTNGLVAQNVMDAASASFSEIETPAQGLGPLYNAVSCVDCHQNVAIGGASQVLEYRAGHMGDGTHGNHPGKDKGDTNVGSSGFVAASALLANGDTLPDRSLINQRALCSDIQEHLTAADDMRADRLSLSTLGDGYVEAVPDATLLALAAKNHGEAIQVPVLEVNGVTAIGKFGWKDQHASLLSFSGDAYVNEMGITNSLFPTEALSTCNPPGMREPNDPGGAGDDIHNFATFMRATKVPPRGAITAAVTQGHAIFEQIGCAGCHVETLTTAPAGTAIHGGAYTISPAIGGKQFHPFSDFLLHDVGTGDGIQQNGPADTLNKVRTMPLWGLRTRTQLLHDGSAGTYAEAIAKHGKEAADEATKYRKLSDAQQALLMQFLGSL